MVEGAQEALGDHPLHLAPERRVQTIADRDELRATQRPSHRPAQIIRIRAFAVIADVMRQIALEHGAEQVAERVVRGLMLGSHALHQQMGRLVRVGPQLRAREHRRLGVGDIGEDAA